MLKDPEILAPGGDFSSSIHALKSGADAVYIGLTSFSARKGAKNLTIDELRSLKNFCYDSGKKVYVALNTLIKDEEIGDIIDTLFILEEIEVDAVIVQDLGLTYIINRYFNLELHASTQLAVHNIHGAKKIKEMGFSRAVLSRELSLKEIKAIKREVPDLELEIFIHGALCYGFSGLCLASGIRLGRSGNRGECGQICRTWFNRKNSKEFPFSMNDLFLGERINDLKEAGVESLKIEGRMKGANYASTISSYYKSTLTKGRADEIRARIEFNRTGSSGYLKGTRGGAQINREYTGHTGLLLGSIYNLTGDSFSIDSNIKLSNRDGIMLLAKSSTGEPFKFPVSILKRDGKRYRLKGKIPKGCKKELYLISSHDNSLKEIKSSSFKPYKKEKPLTIQVLENGISLTSGDFTYNHSEEFQKAINEGDLKAQFNKHFSQGGSSPYKFLLKIKGEKNLFLPDSRLKFIKREFLKAFSLHISINRERLKKSILNIDPEINEVSYSPDSMDLPFVVNFNNLKKEERISLSPVIFNSENYLNRLKEYLSSLNGIYPLIGLNNISHLEFIKELPKECSFFADYGLYVTNKFTKEFLLEEVKNITHITRWVEDEKLKQYPPLFISRTCFKRGNGKCPEDCTRKGDYTISQNGKEYIIKVRNCLTYTFCSSLV